MLHIPPAIVWAERARSGLGPAAPEGARAAAVGRRVAS
jgi:hypothetical protein